MKTASPFPALNVLPALGAHPATMKKMWKLKKGQERLPSTCN